MYLIFIILSMLLLTVFSTLIHELGHVAVAKMLGYKFKGFIFKWWGAVGVKIDVNKDNITHMKLISWGGLYASLLLVVIAVPFINYFLIAYLFWFNVYAIINNMIPFKVFDIPSDGWYIFRYKTEAASQTDQLR